MESRLDFALILFVGLIVHGLFAECVNRAPGLILQHASFVKRVVFPLEILPWIAMLSALFHSAVSLAIWFTFAAVSGIGVSPTALYLPLVFVPLVLLTMACSWFLSSVGVYLRDTGHTVGILTTVLLFLSPIFYPSAAVPPQYPFLIRLNPLTFMVEQARAVLTFHSRPDFSWLAVVTVQNLLCAALAFWWFQKARRGFGDVDPAPSPPPALSPCRISREIPRSQCPISSRSIRLRPAPALAVAVALAGPAALLSRIPRTHSRQLRRPAWRSRRHHRPEWLRQVNAPAAGVRHADALGGSGRRKGPDRRASELGAGFNLEFTGRENVYLNGDIMGLTTAEIDARYARIVEFADIGDFLDQPLKTYSTGMVVRLAFAVIAHVDADVLVIDEALAVGDAFFVQKCMRFLREFMKRGTILFVSHDIGAIVNLCHRALWLHKGEVMLDGSPKDVGEGTCSTWPRMPSEPCHASVSRAARPQGHSSARSAGGSADYGAWS